MPQDHGLIPALETLSKHYVRTIIIIIIIIVIVILSLPLPLPLLLPLPLPLPLSLPLPLLPLPLLPPSPQPPPPPLHLLLNVMNGCNTSLRKQFQCRNIVLNDKIRPLFLYSIDAKTSSISFLKRWQIA